MTRTTPCLRMILQFRQIFLTDALTFMASLPICSDVAPAVTAQIRLLE